MVIRPVGDYVLVRRVSPESVGSIYVTPGQAEQLGETKFYVDAIGPEVTRCEPGDRVSMPQDSKALRTLIENVFLVPEVMIIAIIEEGEVEEGPVERRAQA